MLPSIFRHRFGLDNAFLKNCFLKRLTIFTLPPEHSEEINWQSRNFWETHDPEGSWSHLTNLYMMRKLSIPILALCLTGCAGIKHKPIPYTPVSESSPSSGLKANCDADKKEDGIRYLPDGAISTRLFGWQGR